MIQLTIKELLYMLGGGLGIVAIFAVVVRFLASTWVKARIEASVKAEYDKLLSTYKHELDKNLEDYRSEIRVREQAAKVAELLAYARWHQKEMDGEEFDRRAWELSLWLPTEIYIEVVKCLVGTHDAKHFKEILIDVRKHLLKEKAGSLVADNIIHFNEPKPLK